MSEIVLLDGGMGQELRARSDRPPSPIWSAQILHDDPALVTEVHRDFIKAGAEVITLNAYAVTPARLDRVGRSDLFEALQKEAVRVAVDAEKAEGRDIRIAGCLPPLVASYAPTTTPTRQEALEIYDLIVEAQGPHVDLFICETMASVREAEYATEAGVKSGKPLWCGLTVDDSDGTKMRSGEPVELGARAAIQAGAAGILLNCSRPERISQGLAQLVGLDVPFGAYANGFVGIDELVPGSTVEVLEKRQDLTPEAYADYVDGWIEIGATIVGGCCEVGPGHIAEINRRLGRKTT